MRRRRTTTTTTTTTTTSEKDLVHVRGRVPGPLGTSKNAVVNKLA